MSTMAHGASVGHAFPLTAPSHSVASPVSSAGIASRRVTPPPSQGQAEIELESNSNEPAAHHQLRDWRRVRFVSKKAFEQALVGGLAPIRHFAHRIVPSSTADKALSQLRAHCAEQMRHARPGPLHPAIWQCPNPWHDPVDPHQPHQRQSQCSHRQSLITGTICQVAMTTSRQPP